MKKRKASPSSNAARSTRVTVPSNQAIYSGVPVGQLEETGIVLQAIALRELHYREVQAPEAHVPRSTPVERMSLDLNLEGQLNLFQNQDRSSSLVELRLKTAIKPDPAVKPIEIAATLGALFAATPEVPVEVLLRFVNMSGVRILFPYLRELVSAASGRGIYGPLFLDPIVIGALVSEDELQRILAARGVTK